MTVRRLLVASGLGVCVFAVAWVAAGHSASPEVVNNANVIGGLFGVLSVALSLVALWPRKRISPPAAGAGQAPEVTVRGGLHGVQNVVAASIGTVVLHGPDGPGTSTEATAGEVEDLTIRGPAVTDRWQHTTTGVSPYLSRLDRTQMPRPGYGSGFSPSQPTVRIGILVACDPPDPHLSTSQRKARFLELLSRGPVSAVVATLTSVHPGLHWVSCGGHGPQILGAALVLAPDQEAIPIASARLQLPEPGAVQHFTDPDRAEFILEVRCAGMTPASLLTWRDRLLLMLTALPATLVNFLNDQLQAATYDTPSTEFGTWWATDNDITQLVDTTGLRVEPGTDRSSRFTGWAVADPTGQPADQVVRALIGQLADYTLHLEDYEDQLDHQPSPHWRS